jgi:hypothetical protein
MGDFKMMTLDMRDPSARLAVAFATLPRVMEMVDPSDYPDPADHSPEEMFRITLQKRLTISGTLSSLICDAMSLMSEVLFDEDPDKPCIVSESFLWCLADNESEIFSYEEAHVECHPDCPSAPTERDIVAISRAQFNILKGLDEFFRKHQSDFLALELKKTIKEVKLHEGS